MTGKSSSATWKERLDFFAKRYNAMVADIEAEVRALSDQDLAALIAATRRPTSMNCWWATFRVAPIVREVAEEERRGRAAVSA